MKDSYLKISNFISKEEAKKIHEELLESSKKDNHSDTQAPKSSCFHNHLGTIGTLTNKCHIISETIGETVLPTYTYSRIYYTGSVLEKHTDRKECEISVTVHLDGDKPWDIWVEDCDGNPVNVSLESGDAMVYYGRESPHWREEYDGEYYSQLFLHYVKSAGEYNEFFFGNSTEEDKIQNFIVHMQGILDEDVCDMIIDEYSDAHEWEKTVTSGGLNEEVRKCKSISISSDVSTLSKKSIDKKLFNCVQAMIKNYINKTKYPMSLTEDCGYTLLRYVVGDHYLEHTDSFIGSPRELSVILSLNDDYEGGELGFHGKRILYKLKKGDAIVFPSNFMYPHEITPVTSGTRYSIITWIV